MWKAWIRAGRTRCFIEHRPVGKHPCFPQRRGTSLILHHCPRVFNRLSSTSQHVFNSPVGSGCTRGRTLVAAVWFQTLSALRLEDDLVPHGLQIFAEAAVFLEFLLDHLDGTEHGGMVSTAEFRADHGCRHLTHVHGEIDGHMPCERDVRHAPRADQLFVAHVVELFDHRLDGIDVDLLVRRIEVLVGNPVYLLAGEFPAALLALVRCARAALAEALKKIIFV